MRKKANLTETRQVTEHSGGKKGRRDLRWDKLDNTAHLFPVIAGEQMSNVYRISVTLTELIDPELLQQALDIVLPKFDGFNMRLHTGEFGVMHGYMKLVELKAACRRYGVSINDYLVAAYIWSIYTECLHSAASISEE